MLSWRGPAEITVRHGSNLAACPRCDALQRVALPPPGGRLRCRCCGARLLRNPRGGLHRPLALMISALMLFSLANPLPLVILRIAGREEQTTLAGAAWALWQHGMPSVGLLVFLLTEIVPATLMGAVIYVLTSLQRPRPLPGTRGVLRVLTHLHPWEMGDVFLVSVLVALVKLAGVADVIVGAGLWSLSGAVVLAVAVRGGLEPRLLWQVLSDREAGRW